MMAGPLPRFTVVMPGYNAASTLGTALRSVLTQRDASLEVVLVDDGSSDRTAEAALEAAQGDPRFRLLRQSNRGPSSARNAGAAVAQGEILAFLDCDDRWDSCLLAAHAAVLDAQPSAGASFARVQFFDHDLVQPGRMSAHHAQPSLASALGENPICTASNLVVRRHVFIEAGGFDPALGHAEDQEWLLRLLATTAWQAVGIDAALVHYRMSRHGLSADLDAMLAGWRRMIERVQGYAPAAAQTHGPAAEALFRRYLARRALRTGQGTGIALRHLAAGFRCSPWTLAREAPSRTVLTAAGALAAAVLPASVMCPLLSR